MIRSSVLWPIASSMEKYSASAMPARVDAVSVISCFGSNRVVASFVAGSPDDSFFSIGCDTPSPPLPRPEYRPHEAFWDYLAINGAAFVAMLRKGVSRKVSG